MTQSSLARNCEAIVEIDRDIVEVCRRLDEHGQEPRARHPRGTETGAAGRTTTPDLIPMTSPIALTDAQLREIQTIAMGVVPYDLRGRYLERLAEALRGHDLGDGFVHHTAYEVARSITWTAGRTAVEI